MTSIGSCWSSRNARVEIPLRSSRMCPEQFPLVRAGFLIDRTISAPYAHSDGPPTDTAIRVDFAKGECWRVLHGQTGHAWRLAMLSCEAGPSPQAARICRQALCGAIPDRTTCSEQPGKQALPLRKITPFWTEAGPARREPGNLPATQNGCCSSLRRPRAM